MANTDLAIKIATTLDSTGLRQANKAVDSLGKSVTKLGRNLGLALGTTALLLIAKEPLKLLQQMTKQPRYLVSRWITLVCRLQI